MFLFGNNVHYNSARNVKDGQKETHTLENLIIATYFLNFCYSNPQLQECFPLFKKQHSLLLRATLGI